MSFELRLKRALNSIRDPELQGILTRNFLHGIFKESKNFLRVLEWKTQGRDVISKAEIDAIHREYLNDLIPQLTSQFNQQLHESTYYRQFY